MSDVEPLGTVSPAATMPSLFDDDGSRQRRSRWRRVIGAISVVVLIAIIVGVAVTRSGAKGAGYRTATVSTHSVNQILNGVATVQPVRQASVAFPVSGTVASVAVSVGDSVTTGQPLAALDTTALQATVTQQQAAFDKANLALTEALSGKTPTGGAGGGGAAGAGSSGTTGTGGSGNSASGATGASGTAMSGGAVAIEPVAYRAAVPSARDAAPDPKIAAAEQAVVSAQKQVDSDLASAQQALASANQACAASGGTSTTSAGTNSPCLQSLAASLSAQQTLGADQNKLVQASTALDNLLATGANTSGSGSAPATGSSGQAGGSRSSGSKSQAGTASTGRSAGGASSAASSAPSAASLIAYQRAVDAAQANLAVAQQALAQATIVSPVNGTVVAVTFAPGDTATAGSATQNIVIEGDGGYEVDTTVTVTNLPDVRVGQEATVMPDGAKTPLPGKVVRVGVAGTSDGTTMTYPVVVGLTGSTSGLSNGALASVAIVTGVATNALAIPTSAITTDGNGHTVTVLQGGKTHSVAVQIGALGQTWTQLTGGLHAGQVVVLADLSQPLPGSATATSTNSATNGQNFRLGAGGGGGGFGGAGGAGGGRTGTGRTSGG